MAARGHFLSPLLKAASGRVELRVEGAATSLATKVVAAVDSATRRRGLLDRETFEPGEALVIAPCSAVHTFGMRFPIDLVYAARDGRILKTCDNLLPRRLSAAWGAFAVVELPAGTIERTGVRPGNQLHFVTGDEER